MDKVLALRHLYAMLDALMSLQHHSESLAKLSDIPQPKEIGDELSGLRQEIMSTIIMLVENPLAEREAQINSIFAAAMRRSSNANTI